MKSEVDRLETRIVKKDPTVKADTDKKDPTMKADTSVPTTTMAGTKEESGVTAEAPPYKNSEEELAVTSFRAKIRQAFMVQQRDEESDSSGPPPLVSASDTSSETRRRVAKTRTPSSSDSERSSEEMSVKPWNVLEAESNATDESEEANYTRVLNYRTSTSREVCAQAMAADNRGRSKIRTQRGLNQESVLKYPDGTKEWHRLNEISWKGARVLPTVCPWSDDGVWAILDTGCNMSVHSYMWRKNFEEKLSRRKPWKGLPNPTFFYTSRVCSNFGGLGGANAARCIGKRRWLMAQTDVHDEGFGFDNIATSELRGSDIPMLSVWTYRKDYKYGTIQFPTDARDKESMTHFQEKYHWRSAQGHIYL